MVYRRKLLLLLIELILNFLTIIVDKCDFSLFSKWSLCACVCQVGRTQILYHKNIFFSEHVKNWHRIVIDLRKSIRIFFPRCHRKRSIRLKLGHREKNSVQKKSGDGKDIRLWNDVTSGHTHTYSMHLFF